MVFINEYSDEPKYSIKAVSQKTGIQAVTIRAWEKRYQLLQPKRAINGYRLFSDRDIALLEWINQQLAKEMPISSAVKTLREEIAKGNWPEAVISVKGPVPVNMVKKPEDALIIDQLLRAIVRHDEKTISEVFSQALGAFSLIDLFEKVIVPVLSSIGDQWERGEISVATEHFASGLIISKCQAIYQSLPLRTYNQKMIIGCAPSELHEIGCLMFAILLREAGYRVEFLGPDLPLDDLLEYVCGEHPKAVILSATMNDSIPELSVFAKRLKKIEHAPLLGVGGSVFNNFPEIRKNLDAIYLGKTLKESLARVKMEIPSKSLSMKLSQAF